MKRYFLILVTIAGLFTNEVISQNDLAFYCDVMVNAYEGSHRAKASAAFQELFLQELKNDGSFDKDFKDLKWLSIKSDKAKSFRIYTWSLKDHEGKFKNFGVVQKSDGSLFVLNDGSDWSLDIEYEVLNVDQWYGATYYNMVESKTTNGKDAFILFGYDGKDDNSHVKIMDVLTFEKGAPVFGSEIFMIKDGKRPDIKTRVTLEYSSLANVNFNYNENMEMVVHDFVITRLGISPDGSPAKIPDGTYVGYKYDGKYWNIIEQIAHQVSKPEDIFYQPKPKVEGEKRDLFGRRIKN